MDIGSSQVTPSAPLAMMDQALAGLVMFGLGFNFWDFFLRGVLGV